MADFWAARWGSVRESGLRGTVRVYAGGERADAYMLIGPIDEESRLVVLPYQPEDESVHHSKGGTDQGHYWEDE